MRHKKENLFWRLFPWIFGFMFVGALVIAISQFVLIGWIGYQVVTDPSGTASSAGKIVSDFVAPIVDAVKE